MNDIDIVRIIDIESLNHNVRRYRTEKPPGYFFKPGQATDVAINKKGFDEKFRPFTLTSLNTDNYLEFIIKSYPLKEYPSHSGVTEKLSEFEEGEEFILKEPFGSIKYKGRGLFLAGGTGITPFYAILKDLYSMNNIEGNKLVFSNSTHKDVFLNEELIDMLGKNNVVFTLTQENHSDYEYGRIDKNIILKNSKEIDYYYICGPLSFQEDIIKTLKDMSIRDEKIVIESW